MMRVRALEPLRYRGARFQVGDVLKVAPQLADAWIGARLAEAVDGALEAPAAPDPVADPDATAGD